MPPGPALRPLTPADRRAVGQIAYQTGFFGDGAERYFPAQRLFEALWVGPYFQGEGLGPGAVGFVAEHGGQVVGYVLGTTSQALYLQSLRRVGLAELGPSLRSPRELWPSLRYLLRASRAGTPHADWRGYPAHLHLNLLPAARGQRLGEGLLGAYLERLTALGVRGVQLSTTTENRAALGLYRKAGFEVLAARITPLWTPWLGHPAEHVVMGKTLRVAADSG